MNKKQNQYSRFRKLLLQWNEEENNRVLPWKNERNPYKIWLSEIILQQTRAEQALPYYLKFTENFSTIIDLANAQDKVVFKLWEGLGYYNRCRNMLASARRIRDDFAGIFPNRYEDILQLKGVGKYTAAAIASFAFNLPYAVLDGNVFRVLARFLGIETPIDSTEGKKMFEHLAQEFLEKKLPAPYNQAIMDFGATVCTPKNPGCVTCIFQKHCKAHQSDMVNVLPVKEKSIKVQTRYFHYFILRSNNRIYIQKRTAKDIWQNLFELYLIENNSKLIQVNDWKIFKDFTNNKPTLIHQSSQRLTHRIIESRFYILELNQTLLLHNEGLWIEAKELINFAFPRTIVSFFKLYYYF